MIRVVMQIHDREFGTVTVKKKGDDSRAISETSFSKRCGSPSEISTRVSAANRKQKLSQIHRKQIATADRKRRAFALQSSAVIDQSRSKKHTVHRHTHTRIHIH